jgi:uncharacterized protein (TIGR02001 family)
MKRLLVLAASLPLCLAATAAMSQEAEAEEPAATWEIDGFIAGLTDYRFRGISLSDKDPAVQAELSVAHESGLYGAVWASNTALTSSAADDLEVDLTLGYAADVGNVSLDFGGVYYLYPGNSDFNYVEVFGSVGTAVGPGTLTLGAAYAPSQDNLGDDDNIYVYVSGEMPIGESPLSVHATFGIEDGAFGDSKRDWLIGASYDIGSGFSATLDYVDTARSGSSLGKATAVFSITKSF